MKVQIDGLRELESALMALPDKVAVRLGNKAMREAARDLGATIQAAAPVGTAPTVRRFRTKSGTVVEKDFGRITTNIGMRKLKPEGNETIRYGVGTGKSFWAMMTEFGTSKMGARPFVRPSLMSRGPELVMTIGKTLGEGVAKEARKTARAAAKAGGK